MAAAASLFQRTAQIGLSHACNATQWPAPLNLPSEPHQLCDIGMAMMMCISQLYDRIEVNML